MNCPICGAETNALLCKNCEGNNDKINNWYSTFKSGLFSKETKISLYLSKYTIQGDGFMGIEKMYDPNEPDADSSSTEKMLTKDPNKGEAEAFEFCLVHATGVETVKFMNQNALLIKLTRKIDKFIEDVSLYLPGLPETEEIANVLRQAIVDTKERARVKMEEYQKIREKEDAEFFLHKYNEHIEKANNPSCVVKLEDNNLKGIYLNQDKDIIFLNISGVNRTVDAAYIPHDNINYYRKISYTPKAMPFKEGYFGGSFTDTVFDIPQALHDYVLLELPGHLSNNVPVLPDLDSTFKKTTDASYVAPAANIVLNYYNQKLRKDFEVELPESALTFLQQHLADLDFTIMDESYEAREAIKNVETEEAVAMMNAEKEKAIAEAEEAKREVEAEKAKALREAEEAKAAALAEVEAAKKAAEEARAAALAEAEAARKEAEEAKAAALKELEAAKAEAAKEVEEAKAAAQKEAEAAKAEAVHQAALDAISQQEIEAEQARIKAEEEQKAKEEEERKRKEAEEAARKAKEEEERKAKE
ncbi:MAG: hypothetical protein II699_01010, partial [Lachnospiraceae bacterium]|nr:hypothetical protein [Lachnospiraceae bacterium]